MYPHHFETTVHVAAPPPALFDELDDQERLSAHMMKSSAMMAGSSMGFEFDERRGRAVGSRMRLFGRMLGLSLEVIEVVTERDLPRRKAWETIGKPRLLVIGSYQMGFDIEPDGGGSHLRVFIDYDDPTGSWRIAGKLFGGIYARWCARNMAEGAAAHFAATP
jgi:hypothetical protein